MTQKNIGIDARTLNVTGGSMTYLQNLLTHLERNSPIILFGLGKELGQFQTVPTRINQKNPLLRLFWENIVLPISLILNDVVLFHGPKGVVPLISSCKKVVTVHDLIALKVPGYLKWIDSIYWKWIVPHYIRSADKVIAVSTQTKQDLVDLLNIPEEKIVVIYEGFDKGLYSPVKSADDEMLLDRLGHSLGLKSGTLMKEKIILNVNTISSRKNIQGIIRAFNVCASSEASSRLIICGKFGWMYEVVLNEYSASLYKDRIHFVKYIDETSLACLYRHATVFVYPSFYEGFGLPILEAQASGCPVITSSTSSLPEVAGLGALLVNPGVQDELDQALEDLLTKEEERTSLIHLGFQNCKRFSWKTCADETAAVYCDLLS